MDNLEDKLKYLSIGLVVFGIISFSIRPTYLVCSHENDTCKIYKQMGFTKSFKYSYIKDCEPGDIHRTSISSKEYEKEDMYRKLGYYGYEKKETPYTNYYPILVFDDHVRNLYNENNVNYRSVESGSIKEIRDICENIKGHRSFKYKSNIYSGAIEFWYIYIIVGVLFLLMHRNLFGSKPAESEDDYS